MRESAREYRVAKYREASLTSVDYRTEETEPSFEHGPLEKSLPKPYTVGVYELLNDEDTVLYVGKSKSCIRSRIESHRKNKEFTRVRYFECDERIVDAMESTLIQSHSPLYNRAAGPASPYLGEIAEAEMPTDEEGTIG